MRRRLLFGLLAASAAVLAVLAFFAAGYLVGRWRTRREGVSSAPVVQAVRRIARLATVEMEIADVVRYEEVKTVLVFDIPKNATLRLRGKVTGGFDLGHGFDVEADAARNDIEELGEREELGPETRVIATGGLASVLVPNVREPIDEVDDLLTLTGLRLIWERNRSPADGTELDP